MPTGNKQQLRYFAYGSMCNPVSLNRRGLFPSESYPARLSNYRLAFGLGGMGNIVADAGNTCHGVLHVVTQQEFAVLKDVESNYDIVEVEVTPYHHFNSTDAVDDSLSGPTGSCSEYVHEPGAQPTPCADDSQCCSPAAPSSQREAGHGNSNCSSAQLSTGIPTDISTATASPSVSTVVLGQPITAMAFIVQPAAMEAMKQVHHKDWGTSLPSDRYIRIITAGLRHFKADPDFIQWVAAQPCQHGRQPQDYLKIPTPEQQQQFHPGGNQDPAVVAADLPVFTWQQLQEFQDDLEDTKAVCVLGDKVVQIDMSRKSTSPWVNLIKKHFAGREVVFHMCMMLHEPRLPPLSTPADVRREHIEWAEDSMVEFMARSDFDVQQIGLLRGAADADGVDKDCDGATVRDAAEALHEEDTLTAAPETGLYS